MALKFNYTVAPHLEEFNLPFPAFRAKKPQYTHFIGGGLIFSRSPNLPRGSDRPLEDDNNIRILLLQRALHDAYPGAWEGPGGSCEYDDESLLYGVAREVFEECGLRVSRFVELVATDEWVKLKPDEVVKAKKYTFLVEIEEGKPAVSVNGDGVPADKLPDGTIDSGLARRWEDLVKLDPEEHRDFEWATEEEVRVGVETGNGRYKSFAKHGPHILEGFRIMNELAAK
ncbi:NUDIX hydrolase domain-like protein [Aspergillus pseudoustus]|uniref:NUDIX hydrolase domain-like protein n=1 Tax=Aspergillus pseudoustus TaxID=1810923 RepID=A0ABR4JLG7_9EURO